MPEVFPPPTPISTTVPVSVGFYKLVTSTTGWAANNRKVFWTADDGATWKNITPSDPHFNRQGSFVSAFFLDPTHGWVLLSYVAGPEDDDWGFDLLSTSDAGVTWSTVSIPASVADPKYLYGRGNLSFSDSMHGWMNLGTKSSSAFLFGILLETQDGGKTWTRVKGDPTHSGPVLQLPNGNGFLIGLDNTAFYATHDGGKSFQKVSLPAPPDLAPVNQARYALPVFMDASRGYEVVSYTGPDDDKSGAALFATGDGGVTWKADSVLKGLAPGAFGANHLISTVADSTWIIPVVPQGAMPTLREATHGTTLVADPDMHRLGYSPASFVSPTQGWTATLKGLLSTSDGGETWKVINPRVPGVPAVPGPPVHFTNHPTSSGKPIRVRRPQASSPLLPAATGARGISQNLGFDEYDVALPAKLQTWWQSSPYYDVAFYANGAPSHANDSGLNSAWVSTVRSQGWGLIPIWSGLQAPCACQSGSGTYPNCTEFPHTFSSDPATAKSDGENQADAAYNSVTGLGLDGSIIYVDIEQYDSSYCGAAVQAYVSGWDTEMHNKGGSGSAGVYGSPADTATDFAAADPEPDDVWIAHYDHRVTVWNLGFGLSDSLWPNFQRMKQYGNLTEKWGGQSLNIDTDIVDATIYPPSGTKTYSTLTLTAVQNSWNGIGRMLI